MHATRAAVEEGVLPGGGVALLRAAEALKRVRTQNDDQKTGVDIVRKALSWPARQIAINAGEDGSIIVGKILEKDQYAFGFDAQNGEYVNLVSKGIIVMSGRTTIAGLLITTEAMVAERPKKDSGAPAMPGGGMGGMGGTLCPVNHKVAAVSLPAGNGLHGRGTPSKEASGDHVGRRGRLLAPHGHG